MKNIELIKNDIKIIFDSVHGNLEQIEYKTNIMKFSKSIWKVELKAERVLKEYSICDMKKFNYISYKESLELVWESDTFRVIVDISCIDGDCKWKIAVESLNEDVYVNKVVFPLIGSIKRFEKNGQDDFLLLPRQNGYLVKNPVETLLNEKTELPFYWGRSKGKYENEYPSQYAFQFAAYYSIGDYGHYFATQDPDVHIKTMGFYKSTDNMGFDFALTNYPEGMGETKYYNMPYFFVLDFFEGDWQVAANKYRKWAVNQKWCKKLLLEKDIPDNLLNSDLWMINHTNYAFGTKTEKYHITALLLKEKLNCNISLHWYGWNKGDHDVNYPEYISEELKEQGWPEELIEWNQKFTDNGIMKIPYVNARLWDVNTKSWLNENAQSAALKDCDMQLYEEPWKYNNLRPMCPATNIWTDKIINFCSDYIRNLGFDGLYLDQIAAFNPKLCFDKTHGHPIGGGTWWNDSYHKIVNTLKSIIGYSKILTTESCCETYIDVFDLFLILDTEPIGGFKSFIGHGNCDAVPLFSIIYGDYALSYGSICRFSDSVKLFEYKLVRNLLWGILPTIEGTTLSDLESKKSNEYISIIKKTVGIFKENKNLFLYGRITKILTATDDTIELYRDEDNKKDGKNAPSLILVLWKDKQGKEFYLAYNFGDTSQVIKLAKDMVIMPKKFYIIQK